MTSVWPTPGASTDIWGTQLNNGLAVGHNDDGTHKISSGSGTAGSILYVDSTHKLAQDNANLFWDWANHRLGIGTAAPGAALHVAGTAYITAQGVAIAGFVGPYLAALTNSTAGITLANSTGGSIVRIDTTNNRVGIGPPSTLGSNAPLSPLNVMSPSGGAGASGSDGTGGIRSSFSSGYGCSLDCWDGGTPRWGISRFNGASLLGVVIEGQFSTNNVAVMNGSLGVGISPVHQLQLSTDDAAKATTTTWGVVSDERTKENVVPYTQGLDVIKTLEPVEFDYNGNYGSAAGEHSIGLIAQTHVADAPELFPVTDLPVDTAPQTLDVDADGQPIPPPESRRTPPPPVTEPVYMHNPHALFYMTINALKEIDTRLARLEAP